MVFSGHVVDGTSLVDRGRLSWRGSQLTRNFPRLRITQATVLQRANFSYLEVMYENYLHRDHVTV